MKGVTVAESEWLTRQFEDSRTHLGAVAFRMLGSRTEADDAVQETWIRLSRSDAEVIDNLQGWLTTVVARVCLDMLRSRGAKATQPLDTEVDLDRHAESGPEDDVVMADSVGLAMLVVLESLSPAERVAFVLHDMFAVPFDDIAQIIDTTPAATRQLASRGRRRVQGTSPEPAVDLTRKRQVIDAFLAASRGGDFTALLNVLAPDVVVRADVAAQQMGSQPEILGAQAVAGFFNGRARAARPALIDGAAGIVFRQGKETRVAWEVTFDGDRIAAINLIADPEHIAVLEIEVLRKGENS